MSYFSPLYARNHTVLPGVGTIHTHGVANAFVSSLDHHFLPEGAEKPILGVVRFGVRIADDGSTNWVLELIQGPSSRTLSYKDPRPTETDQTDFPAEVVAEMRRLSETLEERSPTGWFFDVYQRAGDDLKHLDRARGDLVRSIDHLGELLANPAEPRTHFVSKEECGGEKGYNREATAEERETRREWWRSQRAANEAKLVRHDAEKGARTRMLRAIVDALRDWSSTNGADRPLPSKVVADAVAGLDAAAAA